MVDDEVALFGKTRDGQPRSRRTTQIRGFHFQDQAEGSGLEDLPQEFRLLEAGEERVVQQHHGLDLSPFHLPQEFLEDAEAEARSMKPRRFRMPSALVWYLGSATGDSLVTASESQLRRVGQFTQALGGIATKSTLADHGHWTGRLEGLTNVVHRGRDAL